MILLDLHMPGMDGYETAALIRSRKRTAATPIVFLTADLPRRGARLPGLLGRRRGRGVQAGRPLHPEVQGAGAGRPLPEDRGGEAPVRLPAVAAGRARPGEGREGADRAGAAPHRGAAGGDPAVAADRLPLALASSRRSRRSSSRETVEAITGFPAEPLRRRGRVRLQPHPSRRPATVVVRARSPARRDRPLHLRVPLAVRRRPVPGAARPGRAGAQRSTARRREIFGVLLDATDRHSLEEQLAQARKMEAVGQLTGGVAHDFNNLLTVVLGNIDMLAAGATDDERAARRIDADAPGRRARPRPDPPAAGLLAPPAPAPGDARRERADPRLRPAAAPGGRRGGRRSSWSSADEPLRAHVDPAQLETALLNLAVNARDAMPDGGALTIAHSPDAGRTDERRGLVVDRSVATPASACRRRCATGSSSPSSPPRRSARARAWACRQVYGFVRQSGGEVERRERRRAGRDLPACYLPPSAAAAEPRRARGAAASGRRRRRAILVVEDDATVLALTLEMLTGLGYQVTDRDQRRRGAGILHRTGRSTCCSPTW